MGCCAPKDAVTPSLTGADVLFSFAGYVLVYSIVIPFGVYYIYKLLRVTGRARPELPPAWDASNLALFWAAVVALAILIYVILDGFGLGVGILFGTTRDEAHRSGMINSIAPFWDGNETWLVMIGVGLFGGFPVVYAVFLGAFYIPLLLLLVGLIFRGVAFEFRDRSVRMRKVWDYGFSIGSTVVAFVQGAAIGGVMRGLPVRDGQYAGDSLYWLAPFPVLTGIGLVLGYALLGAGWLVLKSEAGLRDWAYARIRWLAARHARGARLRRHADAGLQRARQRALARAALGARVSRDRRARVARPRARNASPPLRRRAIRGDGVVLLRFVRDARRHVLAVHDSVLDHDRERRGARGVVELPILRRGHRDAARDRRLYAAEVLDLSR